MKQQHMLHAINKYQVKFCKKLLCTITFTFKNNTQINVRLNGNKIIIISSKHLFFHEIETSLQRFFKYLVLYKNTFNIIFLVLGHLGHPVIIGLQSLRNSKCYARFQRIPLSCNVIALGNLLCSILYNSVCPRNASIRLPCAKLTVNLGKCLIKSC